MADTDPHSSPPLLNIADEAQPRRSRRKVIRWIAFVLILYLIAAYLLLPTLWKVRVHRHPALEEIPGITHAESGIPGDPLNVALVGSKAQVMKIMLAAKWDPADPLTLHSCLEIAEATVLKRPYDDAPVSSLYLWGRKEDLAFEQPVGDDPRQRHHVRFWESKTKDESGQPLWMGSAVYDRKVGFSERTGQITHVTAPSVDAERDYLFKDLEQTGDLAQFYTIEHFHKELSGKNGGGDPWFTDGRLFVGVIGAKHRR